MSAYTFQVFKDGKPLVGDVALSDDERYECAEAWIAQGAAMLSLSPIELGQIVTQFTLNVGYGIAMQKVAEAQQAQKAKGNGQSAGGVVLPNAVDVAKIRRR